MYNKKLDAEREIRESDKTANNPFLDYKATRYDAVRRLIRYTLAAVFTRCFQRRRASQPTFTQTLSEYNAARGR